MKPGENAYKVKAYRWGTITTMRGSWFGLGVQVDLHQRIVDIYIIWWIIGIGSVVYELEPVEE